MSELPQAETADTDAVQVALQAAQTLWSRGDTTESLRWLKRAAESASDEGADLRSLQLAKAAAELRAKLFPVRPATAAVARVPGGSGADRCASDGGVRFVAAQAERCRPLRALGSERRWTEPVARPEDAPPSSRSPSSAPQYVVHRPREAQRQLMGLSSSTLASSSLESARPHRYGAGYASVPSWSAGAERRTSSPPPLPRAAFDDYEELDAEPDEDEPEAGGGLVGVCRSHVAARRWAAHGWLSAAWRLRLGGRRGGGSGQHREADSDSSPRMATLPPAGFQQRGSSPPPLPELIAFGDEDGDPMRPEQPTVLLPPQEEEPGGSAARLGPAGAASSISIRSAATRARGIPTRGCRTGILDRRTAAGVASLAAVAGPESREGPPKPPRRWNRRRRSSPRACITKRCGSRLRRTHECPGNTWCDLCERENARSEESASRSSWRSNPVCRWFEREPAGCEGWLDEGCASAG